MDSTQKTATNGASSSGVPDAESQTVETEPQQNLFCLLTFLEQGFAMKFVWCSSWLFSCLKHLGVCRFWTLDI